MHKLTKQTATIMTLSLLSLFLFIAIAECQTPQVNAIISLSGADWSFKVIEDGKSYAVDSAKSVGAKELRVVLNSLEDAKDGFITFPVTLEGLNCYYQPALTEELKLAEYDFVNATHAITKGEARVYRSIDVVNSYACFDQKTGRKVLHIYRSQMIDAKGESAWLDMKLDNVFLTVFLNQSWLESASFPVIVDPTFGYTDIGETVGYCAGDYMWGCNFTLTEAGDVIEIKAYVADYFAMLPAKMKCAIYLASDKSLQGNVSSEVTLSSAGAAWQTFTFSPAISLTAGNYYLSMDEDQYINRYYDAGATNQNYYAAKTYADFPPASISAESYENRKFSIYATYTTGGAENVSSVLNSPANASTVTSFQQSFNFTPVLIGSDSFRNATLYVNGSAVANNSSALVNATQNTISYNFTENGFYLWDVQVYNSTTPVFSSNGNFSLTVNYTAPAPTPTPTATPEPGAVTADDAFAIAALALVCAVSLPVAVVVMKRKKEE